MNASSLSDDAVVVDVSGLTKHFGDKTAVDKLSLQLRRGEIFGFLGPNGSGKTTSIRMLCGLLTPDGGSGQALGYDIVSEAAAIKRRVGYMTQRFGLYDDLSIVENLDFVARVHGLPVRRQRVAEAIERLGLTARRKQLAGSLSGGWKQRLALAACMLHQPSLLLLDEPTAGVDPKARREFWEEIHRLAHQGVTVLVSTHYMDEAERCHRLGYIAYGRLLAVGTPDELVAGCGLVARVASGPAAAALAERIEALPAVELVTRFGASLRVCGKEAAALDDALAPYRALPGLAWADGAPLLEDVFIHLMQQATDNFRGAV